MSKMFYKADREDLLDFKHEVEKDYQDKKTARENFDEFVYQIEAIGGEVGAKANTTEVQKLVGVLNNAIEKIKDKCSLSKDCQKDKNETLKAIDKHSMMFQKNDKIQKRVQN